MAAGQTFREIAATPGLREGRQLSCGSRADVQLPVTQP
jgi:hypothetical protein